MENWQINLSLIPSIAIILTSANRMALGLTDEINSRLLSNPEAYKAILPYKILQLKRLSLAIIFMYISLAILIINALLQAMQIIHQNHNLTLMLVSILIFLGGVLFKIQFAYHAYQIRQKQFQNFLSDHKP